MAVNWTACPALIDGLTGVIARLEGVGGGGNTPTQSHVDVPLEPPYVAVKITVPAEMHFIFSVDVKLSNAAIAPLLIVQLAPVVTFAVDPSDSVTVAVRPNVLLTLADCPAVFGVTESDVTVTVEPLLFAVPACPAVPPMKAPP